MQEVLDDILVLQSTNEAIVRVEGNVEVLTEVTVAGQTSKFCEVSSHRLTSRLVSLVKALALGNGERGRGKMLVQRGDQLVEAFRFRVGWCDQISDELCLVGPPIRVSSVVTFFSSLMLMASRSCSGRTVYVWKSLALVSNGHGSMQPMSTSWHGLSCDGA